MRHAAQVRHVTRSRAQVVVPGFHSHSIAVLASRLERVMTLLRPRARVVILLAAGTLVLVGFVATKVSNILPSSIPAEKPVSPTKLPSDRSSPAILDAPPQNEARSSPGRPDGPKEGELKPTAPDDPTDFALKYHGRSPHDLAGALGEVRSRRLDVQKKITQQRMEAGDFIKVYRQPGEELDLGKIATPAADRLASGSNKRNIYVRGVGGRDYVEVSGIPSGEYPEFDALQSEEIWLSQQIESPPSTSAGSSH